MTMSASDFVRGIRTGIIADNLRTYRELFAATQPEGAPDPYWNAALQLYHRLDDADREILFSIISQVMVDTVSNLFAVLDGDVVPTQQAGTRTQVEKEEAFTQKYGEDRTEAFLEIFHTFEMIKRSKSRNDQPELLIQVKTRGIAVYVFNLSRLNVLTSVLTGVVEHML